ncbi:unnamed protein product [Mucor hiemalis]
MNSQGDNKPSLPSIKDLLEGGPGLIDYSPTTSTTSNNNNNKAYSHRRHASEHILSNHRYRYDQPPNVIPPIPNVASSLPFDMQSLSLDKRKTTTITPSPPPPTLKAPHSSLNAPTASTSARVRTHSRSFSDFTHPYPRQISSLSTSPPPLSAEEESNVSPNMMDEEIEEEYSAELSQVPVGGKYICPYCEKGFTRPSSLRTHTYSHTGEKPFKCTEPGCGRKFSVQSNLRRHLRIHRTNKTNTLFISNNIK